MGMMKEHVRGPIKCCETLAQDILYQLRAEALLHHPDFNPVKTTSLSSRRKLDNLPGNTHIRFIGSSRPYLGDKCLRYMLSVLLDNGGDILSELGWEPGDDGHEDLVLQEYNKVEIGATTYITTSMNSSQGGATCNSFMYYSKARTSYQNDEEEPTPPPLDELESLDKPPTDFVHEMTDFYYTSFVGEV